MPKCFIPLWTGKLDTPLTPDHTCVRVIEKGEEMKDGEMRKSEGGESGGGWGVSLDLPRQLINHVKVPHGKNEVDQAQIEDRALHAASLKTISSIKQSKPTH